MGNPIILLLSKLNYEEICVQPAQFSFVITDSRPEPQSFRRQTPPETYVEPKLSVRKARGVPKTRLDAEIQ